MGGGDGVMWLWRFVDYAAAQKCERAGRCCIRSIMGQMCPPCAARLTRELQRAGQGSFGEPAPHPDTARLDWLASHEHITWSRATPDGAWDCYGGHSNWDGPKLRELIDRLMAKEQQPDPYPTPVWVDG